jgi:hypothetical protein
LQGTGILHREGSVITLVHEEDRHAEVLVNIIEMLNNVNEWGGDG